MAMPTGGYLLLSETSYPDFPLASYNHFLYIVRTNAVGDTLWHTLVPRRLNRDWDAASLCDDAQGNVVVAGNSIFIIGTGFTADNVHLTRLRRQTDLLVNDTMLYRPGQTYASTVLRAANGHLVIGGWLKNG